MLYRLHDATQSSFALAPLISPLCLLLLTFEPTDEKLLSSLFENPRLEVFRVSSLGPEWTAFAQRASAVIVVSNGDPFAALLYALSAGIDTPIVIAAPIGHMPLGDDLIAAGAFRCLNLPASRHEIEALTRVLRTRSGNHNVDSKLRFVLDPVGRTMRLRMKKVHLSEREFAILDFLSRRTGTPVAADALVKYVWSESHRSDRAKRALDVHVCNLRKKLAELGLDGTITTLRGFGYVLGRTS